MTLRNDWEFRYTLGEVADAAEGQAAYHRERESYWESEANEAKRDLQESGIEVHEFEITGGKRHQAQLNPAMAQRLQEADEKRQDHQRQAEEYESWVRVLRKADSDDGTHEGTLQLDWKDVMFFGLGDDIAA